MRMNKLFLFFSLIVSLVFGMSRLAFSWGVAPGDGTNFGMLQETAVFLNNSGAVMSAGDVVILDTTATAGTTLGAYVTTTTSADSKLVMGVVKSVSVANGLPVVVVTRGPVDTYTNDSGDSITAGSAVGTATTAKFCGGGSELGIALESGGSTFGELDFIWVDTAGGD